MVALACGLLWFEQDVPISRASRFVLVALALLLGMTVLQAIPVPASLARGASVYATHCGECHGATGAGMRSGTAYTFPPLWGNASYNKGAGMHRVETAAAFIKANMPLGQPNTLTDQEAWDVAALINSKARPPDPRRAGKR